MLMHSNSIYHDLLRLTSLRQYFSTSQTHIFLYNTDFETLNPKPNERKKTPEIILI